MNQKELHIVNAHQNTETGDLIGSPETRKRIVVPFSNPCIGIYARLPPGCGDIDGTVEHLHDWYHTLDPESLSKLPGDLKARIDILITKSKALFEWCDGSLVHAMKAGQYFLLDEISLADDSVLERLNSVLEPHRSLLLAEKGTQDAFVKAVSEFQFLATMNSRRGLGQEGAFSSTEELLHRNMGALGHRGR